jgi:hypothetical protein
MRGKRHFKGLDKIVWESEAGGGTAPKGVFGASLYGAPEGAP